MLQSRSKPRRSVSLTHSLILSFRLKPDTFMFQCWQQVAHSYVPDDKTISAFHPFLVAHFGYHTVFIIPLVKFSDLLTETAKQLARWWWWRWLGKTRCHQWRSVRGSLPNWTRTGRSRSVAQSSRRLWCDDIPGSRRCQVPSSCRCRPRMDILSGRSLPSEATLDWSPAVACQTRPARSPGPDRANKTRIHLDVTINRSASSKSLMVSIASHNVVCCFERMLCTQMPFPTWSVPSLDCYERDLCPK